MAAINGHNRHVKGSGYERTIAKTLTKWTGVSYSRTMASGAAGSEHGSDARLIGDIFSPIGYPDPFNYECKNHGDVTLKNIVWGTGELKQFMEQVITDAHRADTTPVLIMHINREADYVMLPYSNRLYNSLYNKSRVTFRTYSTYQDKRLEQITGVDWLVTTMNDLTSLNCTEVFNTYSAIQREMGAYWWEHVTSTANKGEDEWNAVSEQTSNIIEMNLEGNNDETN